MSTIRVPSPLRSYVEGEKEINIEAESVEKALEQLTLRYPGIRSHLFDESGDLRLYINLFLNERDIRDLEGTATPISAGDQLMILPSIAGGLSRYFDDR